MVSDILPDLPDVEPYYEMKFHLDDLKSDLPPVLGAVQKARAILSDPAQDDAKGETCDALINVHHNATYHCPRALFLAEALLQNPDAQVPELDVEAQPHIPDAPPMPGSSLAESRAKALEHLNQVEPPLREAIELVNRTCEVRGERAEVLDAISKAIPAIYTKLHDEALPHAIQAASWADTLWRLSNPVLAARYDRDNEPGLHEGSRPDAATLAACPTCGAPLGEDDRTSNGSFCKNCRTHWYPF